MTGYDFWLKAAQWGSYTRNGDPGACMYGFDERGCVQSEEHRAECIAWIDGPCRRGADASDEPDEDHAELNELRSYLLTAPVVE